MAERRYFRAGPGAGWPDGSTLSVKLYRHRGMWAFYEGDGFTWYRSWGFKSELAALRAACHWLGREWRLLPKRKRATNA